jgi:hypothetical protein
VFVYFRTWAYRRRIVSIGVREYLYSTTVYSVANCFLYDPSIQQKKNERTYLLRLSSRFADLDPSVKESVVDRPNPALNWIANRLGIQRRVPVMALGLVVPVGLL